MEEVEVEVMMMMKEVVVVEVMMEWVEVVVVEVMMDQPPAVGDRMRLSLNPHGLEAPHLYPPHVSGEREILTRTGGNKCVS
ncbi:unnamed protein product [Boreogadus saida]